MVYHGYMGTKPLDESDLRQIAPSIFAETAHESRSADYAVIPSSAVVTALRSEGFVPYAAQQGKSRVPGKADYTKHMVRFRHTRDMARPRKLGQVFNEVILRNSNDGTSAYKLDAGLFRFACLNGLIVADRSFAPVRIGHRGNVVDQVIEGSYQVLSESIRAIDMAESWQGIKVSYDESLAMAEGVHNLRFADAAGTVTTPIEPAQLLTPRRSEDAGDSLWLIVNRLQENAMRGGLQGRNAAMRHVTTREVRGIDQSSELNQGIWRIGEMMAEFKA